MKDHIPLKSSPAQTTPSPNPRPLPPRTRKPPVYYQPKQKKRSCCRAFCCWLCLILIIAIIILGVAIGIFFAWFQPKLPNFHFRPLELNRFNITTKPDGSSLLNSTAIVRIEAKNPNKKLRIFYDEIAVTLTLDDEIEFGSASLPAFKQPTKNVTILKFILSEKNQFIDSSSGARLKKRVKNENAEVNAEVKTKVGFGIGKLKIGMLPVNINCGGINLKQLDKIDAPPPKCSLNTLRWITIH